MQNYRLHCSSKYIYTVTRTCIMCMYMHTCTNFLAPSFILQIPVCNPCFFIVTSAIKGSLEYQLQPASPLCFQSQFRKRSTSLFPYSSCQKQDKFPAFFKRMSCSQPFLRHMAQYCFLYAAGIVYHWDISDRLLIQLN